MAKISLRAYNREIETLIERGQSEEAIAHCKFILKSYPKHLDTYRLLGKAFLETQRYSEAADILLRILSVQPDDFVSQIGMSIIREDEGNLDAALFHMERAFEIQPSNAAIQDELRRLYGRRDGVEPSRLRLTRGALVRMYARGDLSRQAIAEARAALAEDNQRLDIQIILARMYFLSGQKAEAADISSKLVAKLQYCFEANRILAEVLPETSRAEDARIYQQRLLALDPYLGYLSETAHTASQVPDQAVTLDRLEWAPSLESEQQPSWAKDLGVSIQTGASEEQAEDWLSPFAAPVEEISTLVTPAPPDLEQEITQNTGAAAPENEPRSFDEELDELPAWMSSAGWGLAGSTAETAEDQRPVEALPNPEEEAEGEAAPAEMPAWLKDLAPAPEPVPSPENEEERLDWLNSILPPGTPTAQAETPSEPAAAPEAPNAENETVSPVNQDLPDWLRSNAPSTDEAFTPPQLSEEPLPDWLLETEDQAVLGQTLPVEPPAASEALDQPQPEVAATIQEPESSITEAETPAPYSEEKPASEPDLSNIDDAMAWLESLAVKQGADEEGLITRPEDRTETPPDWVVSAAQTPEIQEPVEVLPVETQGASEVETETSLPEIQTPLEVPLQAVSQDEQPPVLEELPPLEASPSGVEEAVAIEEAISQEAPSTPEPAPEAAAPADMPGEDMDAAFAWLESLAAKQGADQESLLVSPEERLESPPDWVKEQSTEPLDQPVSSLESTEPAPQNEASEWVVPTLEEPASQPGEEISSSEEMPEWLKSMEQTPERLVVSEPAESETSFPSEEEIEAGPVTETTSPDWVQEDSLAAGEETPQETEEAPQAAEPETIQPGKTGPLPHWLVSPAPVEEIRPSEAPVEETGEPALPDWLKDEQPTGFVEPESSPETTLEAPPLPDWLQNLESEKIEVPIPEISEAPLTEAVPQTEEITLSSDPDVLVKQAHSALSVGQLDLALSAYNQLVQNDQHIEDTIHDLRDALYRYPVESSIWQTLGDALFRANRVQDALDAYTKAEELLK